MFVKESTEKFSMNSSLFSIPSSYPAEAGSNDDQPKPCKQTKKEKKIDEIRTRDCIHVPTVDGLLTNGKYWTTDCIRHSRKKLCSCCPNGVHIDVDFDGFYKTLTKLQKGDKIPSRSHRHHCRVHDRTIDALLGYEIQSLSIDDIVRKNRNLPPRASPDVQESLEQAIHDFEETLIQSSVTVRSPTPSPLSSEYRSSTLSLRNDSKICDSTSNIYEAHSYENRRHEESDNCNDIPIKTISNVDNVKKPFDEQLYISEIEDQLELIPELEAKIYRLEEEKKNILTKISEQDWYSDNTTTFTKNTSQISSPVDNNERTFNNKTIQTDQKNTKEIGVNCVVMTRDVGIVNQCPKSVDSAVNATVHTSNAHTMTDGSPQVEDQQSERKYSLHQILHNEKRQTSVGTQTKSSQLKRDVHVQTMPNDCLSIDGKVQHRSVSTSTLDVAPIMNDKYRQCSKYCQTADCLVKEKVLQRHCSTQTDRRSLQTRDAATNTSKKMKLVDSATDAAPYQPFCEKCSQAKNSNLPKDGQTLSKIPRPKNVSPSNVVNKRKTLMRQDTFVKIPASDFKSTIDDSIIKRSSPKCSYQPEQDEFEEYTDTLEKENSFFQPISVDKTKKEPSKRMKGAMKVLNDYIQKYTISKLPMDRLKTAISVIQEEWFKVSSLSTADPQVVEDYVDAFEDISTGLLQYIVNMRDNAGNTAMHYAVSHGNFDVVSILLDSKVCDINSVNDAGYSSIMLVSLAEIKRDIDRDVIRHLFKMADVNLRAKTHGQTTLMLASSHGKLDIVNLLLESGADVNIQDNDGSTALMCAAEHGYLDVVNVLASHPDCDLTLKDRDGSTALTIAMEAGHREVGVALYARQHFTELNYSGSTKDKRSRSAYPILMQHRSCTPPITKLTPTEYEVPAPKFKSCQNTPVHTNHKQF